MESARALARFDEAGIRSVLRSYSAIDHYFFGRLMDYVDTAVHVIVEASLADVARVFDNLRFGDPLSDAVVMHENTVLCIRCMDDDDDLGYPFTVLKLQFDWRRATFLDPCGAYYDLRKLALARCVSDLAWWQVVAEAAKLVSRYHFTFEPDHQSPDFVAPPVSAEYQRRLLEQILTGRAPEKGLRLLHETGIVDSWWPELAAMANVPHSKDHHPEGDVWEHTLATFAHRKSPDLMLSLGLLLHDVGKPQAVPRGDKRFFAHAEIGARIGRRFLTRLGFAPRLIDGVAFLGRNHMMPAALGRVRPEHAEELMSSDLFPHLLELYRADMLSSFARPEPYYHACRLYQRHLRGRPLPQRTSTPGRRRGPRPRARRFKG